MIDMSERNEPLSERLWNIARLAGELVDLDGELLDDIAEDGRSGDVPDAVLRGRANAYLDELQRRLAARSGRPTVWAWFRLFTRLRFWNRGRDALTAVRSSEVMTSET